MRRVTSAHTSERILIKHFIDQVIKKSKGLKYSIKFVEHVKDKVLRLRLKIKSSGSEQISGAMAPLPHLKYGLTVHG